MKRAFLAVLSGALLVLCFPLHDWSFLAWVALIPLLAAVASSTWRGAIGLGLLTGAVWSLGSLSWVSVYHPLALPLTALVFSVYPAAAAVFMLLLMRTCRLPAALAVALGWTSVEYLRSLGTLGFPWLSLGYSQYGCLPVVQQASVTGVFGVTFLIALANGAVAGLWLDGGKKRARRLLAAAAVLVAVSAVSGQVLLSRGAPPPPGVRKSMLRVGLVQPNIPAEADWVDEAGWILSRYEKLGGEIARLEPELIVWPEAAVRFPLAWELSRDGMVGRRFRAVVQEGGVPAIVGSPHEEDSRATNCAFLLGPRCEILQRYEKVHLVPFGEIIPWKPVFGFVQRMVPDAGGFEPGRERVVFPLKEGVVAGPLICFEGIFGDLARRSVASGATVLVNITNDDWSKSETSHFQHAAMSVFRAVENRVPVVRVGNSGVSFVLDGAGRRLGGLEWGVPGVACLDLEWVPGRTFYARHGDFFARAVMLAAAAAAVVGVSIDRAMRRKL